MRIPVPAEMREQLADDPFMQSCIIGNIQCEGRIEWNHAFSYSGKRQNKLWALIPMCHFHHYHEANLKSEIRQAMRTRIWYFEDEHNFRIEYPKSNLV